MTTWFAHTRHQNPGSSSAGICTHSLMGLTRLMSFKLCAASAGWYCVGCEEYKQDDEVGPQHICPMHQKPCVHREEENFFFRLSSYQKQLEVGFAL